MIRSTTIHWLAALCLLFCITTAGADSPVGTLHSIQVGAFHTESEANEHASAVEAEWGASPVHVIENPDNPSFRYRVALGNFPYLGEAWVYRNLLPEEAFPGAFIAVWEWDGRNLEPASLPLDLPFSVEGLQPAQELSTPAPSYQVPGDGELISNVTASSDLDELDAEELLTVGFHTTNNPLGREALLEFLDDPTGTEAALAASARLVRRAFGGQLFEMADEHIGLLRDSGVAEYEALGEWLAAYSVYYQGGDALDAFLKLASDEGLPPSIRYDGLRMAAGIAHSQRNYPLAYVAFEQLERLNPDSATAVEARMQRVGFLFELVGREIGSWSEVRAKAESVEEMSGPETDSQATARLMYLETYFMEDNLRPVIREADRLVEDFPDVTREVHAAKYWKARALQKLLRHDEATAIFNDLADSGLSSSEVFPALDVRAKSLYHLGRIHRRTGNNHAAQAAETRLLNDYPDSAEARLLQSSN